MENGSCEILGCGGVSREPATVLPGTAVCPALPPQELRAHAAVLAREKESLLATLREKDSLISELEANQEALRAQSRR